MTLNTTYCEVQSCTMMNFPRVIVPNYVDILLWTLAPPSLLFGALLTYAIVHYEWYGGDSQKRSLGNRILSQCAISNFLHGCFSFVVTLVSRYDLMDPTDR